jgi:hypothetical protein
MAPVGLRLAMLAVKDGLGDSVAIPKLGNAEAQSKDQDILRADPHPRLSRVGRDIFRS